MRDVVIVGTDTDAGKTTFALVFLTAFADRFAYWKPVETGESDTEKVRQLVTGATVFEPVARFFEPVAPPLAAKRAGRAMPTPKDVAARKPVSSLPLLIETFGSPMSPFTDDELQIELLRELDLSIWLVVSSAVGAVGRTLQCRESLRAHGLDADAVILLGESDEFAAAQIAKRCPESTVVSIRTPREWSVDGVSCSAREQRETLDALVTQARRGPGCGWAVPTLLSRDRAAVWHPYTSLADPVDPLPVIAAEREFLHLADGRSVIDAISSWWTILHGHRHPPLMKALRDATRELDHVLFAGVTHPHAVEFAEMLLRSSPLPDGKVFYSDNGSTAVEVALKLAYQYHCHRGDSSRTLFVGFDGGYHGDTFGPMAVGRDPVFFGRFEPFLFRAARVPVSAERLDDFLKVHANEVAAVIIEPLVQGAGGMKMHSSQELKAIFDVAKRHNVLFIADEVMTANRTGTVWACEQAGIVPDLICAGKTLTGGVLPLAATLVSPEIVAAFVTPDRTKTFFHGHSFTANPLACAVAVANWKLIESGSWKKDAVRIENFWKENLLTLQCQSGMADVRVCGTIAAVELDAAGGYLAEIGPAIRQKAIEMSVLLRPLGNVVYAMPPLCTSDESLARIVNAIREVAAGLS